MEILEEDVGPDKVRLALFSVPQDLQVRLSLGSTPAPIKVENECLQSLLWHLYFIIGI
jgi:hypothetical protein